MFFKFIGAAVMFYLKLRQKYGKIIVYANYQLQIDL